MKPSSREDRIPGYLYALDGLRAVALIFIVMFHTWQQSWIYYNIKLGPDKYLLNLEIVQRFGYVAIDIFFVLSGFCLFYPIARDIFGESKFTGWRNFFIKRARRIYPAYILMLIILIIVPALSWAAEYDVHNAKDVAKHFIYHVLFIHNIDNATIGSTISTAWTMSVEVQFYLLFPLLCIPFRKKPVLTFAGLAVLSAAIRLYMVCNTDFTKFYHQAFTPAYLDIFGIGMLAAYFVVRVRNKCADISKFKLPMTLMSVLCVYLAVSYMYWLKGAVDTGFFPNGFAPDVYFRWLYRGIFAAIIAGFIFTACFSYSFWEKKIWGNRFFIFLSSISYTVYLWHQNIYIYLNAKKIPYTTSQIPMHDRAAMEGKTLICLVSSIVIGIVVTKFIEGPIVKYGIKGLVLKLGEMLHLVKPAPIQPIVTNKEKKHGKK